MRKSLYHFVKNKKKNKQKKKQTKIIMIYTGVLQDLFTVCVTPQS